MVFGQIIVLGGLLLASLAITAGVTEVWMASKSLLFGEKEKQLTTAPLPELKYYGWFTTGPYVSQLDLHLELNILTQKKNIDPGMIQIFTPKFELWYISFYNKTMSEKLHQGRSWRTLRNFVDHPVADAATAQLIAHQRIEPNYIHVYGSFHWEMVTLDITYLDTVTSQSSMKEKIREF